MKNRSRFGAGIFPQFAHGFDFSKPHLARVEIEGRRQNEEE
jgi:hypothetical protein